MMAMDSNYKQKTTKLQHRKNFKSVQSTCIVGDDDIDGDGDGDGNGDGNGEGNGNDEGDGNGEVDGNGDGGINNTTKVWENQAAAMQMMTFPAVEPMAPSKDQHSDALQWKEGQ